MGVSVVIFSWLHYNEIDMAFVWLEWEEKDVNLADGAREFYG